MYELEEALGVIVPNVTVPPTTPVKDGSKFSSIANSVSSLFTSAAPIVSAVVPKRNTAGGSTPMYSLPGSTGTQPPAPPVEKKSNMLKYGVIAAVVLAVGFVGYKIATKKKKKALGDITASTKSGRRAQRKAIFARLDSEGKSMPKKRKKSKVKKARI